MNITKKPQIKNNNVLNINPTSVETVVSAFPVVVKLAKKIKGNINLIINLKKFVIKPPVKVVLYIFKKK
tara:strand:+ start:1310 stop:1516 length:207 start_codon:yes stop_codon:yes gene_type:complete